MEKSGAVLPVGRTTTQSFGTGGRQGHDSSPYYSRKINEGGGGEF